MTCPDAKEWDLLAMEACEVEQAESMVAHAGACGACRAPYEAARRGHVDRVRMYEAFDRDHDKLREQLMAALPDELPRRPRVGRVAFAWRRLGDSVMSLNNTASRRAAAILLPAACLVIAVVLFLSASQKSVFASAIEQFRTASTIVCRVTITAKVRLQADAQAESSGIDVSKANGHIEAQTVRAKLYLSAAHGVRRDAYEDDVVVSTTYTTDSGSTLTLYPADRTYQKFDMDDELKEAAAATSSPDIHFMSLAANPDRLLRGLRALTAEADGELGRDIFDGREVIGYEIAGEKVGFGPPLTENAEENRAELWVDAETRVASRLVFHFVSSIPGTRDLPLTASFAMTIVYDRFEWDLPLSAEWFEPVIPEDYSPKADGMPEQVRMPDEAALLEALRVFGDLAGRYPASLNTLSVGQEVAFVLGSVRAKQINAEKSGGPGPETPDFDSVGERLQGLALYAFLEMRGSEPEYFGGPVKPGEADAVLMKWQLDEGGTRVIYGDLRAETVSGEQTPEE